MAIKWGQNGDKMAIKMATKWRQNGDKMATKWR